jgi:hypothetical protein
MQRHRLATWHSRASIHAAGSMRHSEVAACWRFRWERRQSIYAWGVERGGSSGGYHPQRTDVPALRRFPWASSGRRCARRMVIPRDDRIMAIAVGEVRSTAHSSSPTCATGPGTA